MGGARNLKLGKQRRAKARAQSDNKFVLMLAKCEHYLSYCLHRTDVAGSKGRDPGQGVRAKAPSPKAETPLDFEGSIKAANLPVKIQIFVLFCRNFGKCMVSRGHFIIIRIFPQKGSRETAKARARKPSSFAAYGLYQRPGVDLKPV